MDMYFFSNFYVDNKNFGFLFRIKPCGNNPKYPKGVRPIKGRDMAPALPFSFKKQM